MSPEIGVFMAGLIAGILIGFWVGIHLENNSKKQEAVQKGHAEWVPDKDGKAQFKWKDLPK